MLAVGKNKIILLALLSFLSSCRSTKVIENESWLIGKWSIIAINTGAEIPKDDRSEYNEIMAKMIKNGYMQFNLDNSFEMQLMRQKLKGTYRLLNKETEILTAIEGQDDEDHFKLWLIEPRKIILETEDDQGIITLTLIKE
ncbi:MAG: hypothetical protein ISR55_03135 [Bacteroidetes bacterium]|nr:hypothetical protein [Bacteroidota bacterium]